jgi:DNA-binding NarL/FixJ family response regulator
VLRAGANGFLLKDVTAERLFDAVRVVAVGAALPSPSHADHWPAHQHHAVTRPPSYDRRTRERRDGGAGSSGDRPNRTWLQRTDTVM